MRNESWKDKMIVSGRSINKGQGANDHIMLGAFKLEHGRIGHTVSRGREEEDEL